MDDIDDYEFSEKDEIIECFNYAIYLLDQIEDIKTLSILINNNNELELFINNTVFHDSYTPEQLNSFLFEAFIKDKYKTKLRPLLQELRFFAIEASFPKNIKIEFTTAQMKEKIQRITQSMSKKLDCF